MNPDLETLHDTLIELITNLNDAIGSAPDSDTVDAITTEIAEVSHRVTILGNVLFANATVGITTAVAKVTAATGDVQKAIAQVQSVTSIVKTITPFLALVDKAIDTAKLFLP